jgi:hypothetical protein
LVHVFYAIALLASALSVFGGGGLIVGVWILAFWAGVFSSGSRPRALRVQCLQVLVLGCVLSFTVLPWIDYGHRNRPLWCCELNLRQIAIALHNYHDIHGSFPPAFLPDKQGRPMHSWRVLLLPFLCEHRLYEKYSFAEPWDGPNNRKLLSLMPSVYQCPAEPPRAGGLGTSTSYLAVVGPRTAWPGARGRKLSEMPHSTILVIEKHGTGIPWTQPRDMSFDEVLAQLSASGPSILDPHHAEDFLFEYHGGCNVALAGARVEFVPQGCGRELWAALLTIDDNDPRRMDEALDTMARVNTPRLNLGNCYRLAVFVLLVLLPLPWVWRHRGPRSDAPAPSGRNAAETIR